MTKRTDLLLHCQGSLCVLAGHRVQEELKHRRQVDSDHAVASVAYFVIVWKPSHSDRKDTLRTEIVFWSIIFTAIVFIAVYRISEALGQKEPIIYQGIVGEIDAKT